MTKQIDLRLTGLLALSAALAAPLSFAQNTTPTADAAQDAAQTAAGQPASPAPQSDAAPAKKTWADLDTDKDGNLNKAEAATIPSLQAVFDQADANADGALSGDEYKTYLAMNGQGKDAGQTSGKPKK
ncbi:MAG: EF-hand domain-containing protein [Lysobacteraceae bacterium]